MSCRSPGAVRDQHNKFFLGRANDNPTNQKECVITVDEFNFWSAVKTPDEIRENGPFYCYHMSMDEMRGTEYIVSYISYTELNHMSLELRLYDIM